MRHWPRNCEGRFIEGGGEGEEKMVEEEEVKKGNMKE
jgi:hypothetical protein